MATLTLPATLGVSRFELERVSVGLASRSQVSGVSQVRETLGWYWRALLAFPPCDYRDAAALEAFLASFGAGDVLQLGHPVRPVPGGSMRGAPTVSGLHAAGARSVLISATNGATLRAGDLLGILGRLYMVAAPVTFGAVATAVSIAGGLQGDVPGATAVAWDRPATTWRRLAPPRVVYRPGYIESVELDLEEKWL